MQVVVVLTDVEERALRAAVERINAAANVEDPPRAPITPEQFVDQYVREHLALLVRAYRERVANDLIQRFESADPAKQAEVYELLKNQLPADKAVSRG